MEINSKTFLYAGFFISSNADKDKLNTVLPVYQIKLTYSHGLQPWAFLYEYRNFKSSNDIKSGSSNLFFMLVLVISIALSIIIEIYKL